MLKVEGIIRTMRKQHIKNNIEIKEKLIKIILTSYSYITLIKIAIWNILLLVLIK